MVQLYVEGQIDDLRKEESKKTGKKYVKVYFKHRFDGGGFDSFVVVDYLNREWKVGEEVKIPVFTSPYKNKEGVIVIQYLAKDGDFKNTQLKAQPVRV